MITIRRRAKSLDVDSPDERDDEEITPVVAHKELSWQAALFWRVVALALGLFAWQLIHDHLVNPLFIATPGDVLTEIRELADRGLLERVIHTTQTAFTGWVIGSAVGIALGLVLGLLPRVEYVLGPFTTMFNAMPRLALAPLFIVWFGVGRTSHVALVVSVITVIVLTNTIAGVQSVDSEFVTIARLSGASRRQMVRMIVVPHTIPWVVAALRLAWAYSLTATVVGEMFLGAHGLGFMISQGGASFNTAAIFAGVLLTVLIAFVVDVCIRLAERRLLAWRPNAKA